MKRLTALILVLALSSSSLVYATPSAIANLVAKDDRTILWSMSMGDDHAIAYVINDIVYQEGEINSVKYSIESPLDPSTLYEGLRITEYDSKGLPSKTLSVGESTSNEPQVFEYDYKTGSISIHDRLTSELVNKLQISQLSFASLDATDVTPTRAYGNSYYTDMCYSYVFTPKGTQLIHRSVSYDSARVQTANNIVKDIMHFKTGDTISVVIAVIIFACGVVIPAAAWPGTATVSGALQILGIGWTGVTFVNNADIPVRADEFDENHRVEIRLNGSSGSLVSSPIVKKLYHTVRIYDTAGRLATVVTQAQFAGVWGSGFEVAQAAHLGGDAN